MSDKTRPIDTLEIIEDDAKENVCVYFAKQGSPKCSSVPILSATER